MSTRRLLIDSYLQLGYSEGFDSVSLKMIADKVGIEKASVYSHFKCFEDLKQKALDFCQKELEEKIITVDFKTDDLKTLFEKLLYEMTDTFAVFPLNCYISLLEQKKLTDKQVARLSDNLNSMLRARILVALDYAVQRYWANISDTDLIAEVLTPYLRNGILQTLTDKEFDHETVLTFLNQYRH